MSSVTPERDAVEPDVVDVGPGGPELAVVGGVHGDEPSGVRAVEWLRDADLDLRRGVRTVVANPAAVDADERYLDADLNRAFPGDPDAEERERRLAARLCSLTEDLPTLSLHSTHSQPEPMVLASCADGTALELAAGLPTPYVVDERPAIDGSFVECSSVVTVEAGCQHTDEATETAERQARAFLHLLDALEGDGPESDPDFFAMHETVEKPPGADPELYVDNFERVEAGTTYASVGEEELVAGEPFVPVLMSACGYEDVFGYRGTRLGGSLDEARAAFEARN